MILREWGSSVIGTVDGAALDRAAIAGGAEGIPVDSAHGTIAAHASAEFPFGHGLERFWLPLFSAGAEVIPCMSLIDSFAVIAAD